MSVAFLPVPSPNDRGSSEPHMISRQPQAWEAGAIATLISGK